MAAGGEPKKVKSAIPPKTMIAFGLIGGLIGVYAGHFLSDMFGPVLSFFGALGAICAIVWGADTVRRVCSYGIGTGVPSIGMLAIGMGIVAALFGLAVGGIAGPIIAVIVATILGLIIGLLGNRLMKMGVPIMETATAEIAAAGTITIIGISTAMAGTFEITGIIDNVISNGFIAVVFIVGAIAILHPFNANLGPDEKQDRTLSVAFIDGSIAMILAGIVVAGVSLASAVPAILIGLAIWLFAFAKYLGYVKRDAYKVVGTGLLPTEEELS